MLAVIGGILVGIWIWDEAAVRIDTKTGQSTLPFLWGGILPGTAALAKYVSEFMVAAVGFVLIILHLMRKD